MVMRIAVFTASLAASLLMSWPSSAESMNADEARRFVIGKHFFYNCFEGTHGAGRIYADGSVAGSIQFQGAGPVRYVHLPPNTLQVKGESVCASLRGLPISPCFELDKTDARSFRGAVSGLGFASCTFVRASTPHAISSSTRLRGPIAIQAAHAQD
jgi:hypothetical protein